MTADQRQMATTRGQRRAAEHAESRRKLQAQIAAERDLRPLSSLTLMDSLARVLPDNVAVVEEAVTTTNTVFERLGALKNTSGYFGHRGWALGWGLGCAIGAKLAWPDRPVLALLGEGAAMYGIQGLWSAAHHHLPVTFVICNNAQYQILKIGGRMLQLPAAKSGRYVGHDIAGPEIDFVSLAQSLGVEAVRITEPDALSDCVSESFQRSKPLLVDVPIQRGTPSRLNYG